MQSKPVNLGFDVNEKDLLKAFNKAARAMYKKKNISPDLLSDAQIKPLISQINNVLQSVVTEAITHEIPETMLAKLQNDIFVFSGAKTYSELKELSELLLTDSGTVKPFNQFFNDVRDIHNKYNKFYLEAEYIFATQSAQQAAKWSEFEKDGDRYFLQYRTAGDDHVRPEHMALNDTTLPIDSDFWREYYPPNGWRCRCNVVQVLKHKYKESDEASAIEAGKLATTQINKDGLNVGEMFRFNAGKDAVIFPPNHPYYKNIGKKEVEAAIGTNEKAPTPKKEPTPKPTDNEPTLNLADYIKGKNATNNDVIDIIKAYADKSPDDFARGLENVSFKRTSSYMMMQSKYINRTTGEYTSKSSITVSSYNFGGFNPAKELREALSAIKNGNDLTFNQEYAIESLWHEILHAKTKTSYSRLLPSQTQAMETLNQFCARHTYTDFLTKLGGTAKHQDDVLEKGLGYGTWVNEFRTLLKNNGIDEKDAVSDLMPKLLSDYKSIKDVTKEYIEKGKKDTDGTK